MEDPEHQGQEDQGIGELVVPGPLPEDLCQHAQSNQGDDPDVDPVKNDKQSACSKKCAEFSGIRDQKNPACLGRKDGDQRFLQNPE